jgi:hypothetical protein
VHDQLDCVALNHKVAKFVYLKRFRIHGQAAHVLHAQTQSISSWKVSYYDSSSYEPHQHRQDGEAAAPAKAVPVQLFVAVRLLTMLDLVRLQTPQKQWMVLGWRKAG